MNHVIQGCTFSPIGVHITACKWRRPKYIVIHYTAGASSAPGRAEVARKGWLTRKASADFVVDDATTLQVNPNPYTHYCWSVGDGGGKYGITNANSVSIEICSNLRKGTSAAMPNHEGWTFTEASLERAAVLTRQLMRTFGIDKDHVVRHYDASRKACPGIIGWNDGNLYDPQTAKPTGKKNNSLKWKAWKEGL